MANRDSWNILPLPTQRARLNIKRTFTEQEYTRLAHGFIPEVMEHKWFIYMENDVLYFHRSWTGFCIYEVHFNKQRTINTVLVNRDDRQYRGIDNERDKRILNILIDDLLLG